MRSDVSDEPTGKAIAYLMFGVAGGLGLDLCAKQILASYSLEQFVFLRSVIGLVILLLLAKQFGGTGGLRTERHAWHFFRTLLAICTMFGFFYGLSRMPLVDALTLAFTAPLMMTALSAPVLGEPVGWRRWTAVIVGFSGVLLILRPGTQQVSIAHLAVLLAALAYAGLAITARKLATTESSYSLSVYVIAGPMLVSLALLGTGDWRSPDLVGWSLFFLAGICSVIAWIGIVGGYRRASPAMLAPFEYTALIGGAVAGYLFWNEIPDRWVVLGAIIIIASGLYVVYREVGVSARRRQLQDRQSVPVSPTAP